MTIIRGTKRRQLKPMADQLEVRELMTVGSLPTTVSVKPVDAPVQYGVGVPIEANFSVAWPQLLPGSPPSEVAKWENPTASGSITFLINSSLSESFPVVADPRVFVRDFTLTNLPAGDNVITGTFFADGQSVTSTGSIYPFHINVTPAPTTTTLAVTPSSPSVGAFPYATLTATVNPNNSALGPASGQVVFTSGSTVLGTANLVNGTATVFTKLQIGGNEIHATYKPSGNLASSSTATTYNAGSASENFINSVYTSVLHRSVDTAALKYWDHALASHRITKAHFIKAIMNSAEARHIAVG